MHWRAPNAWTTLRIKVFHGASGVVAEWIDDRGPHKSIRIELDHVEHIAIIELMVAHLDQVDSPDTGGPANCQKFFGCERRRLHVGHFEARCKRVVSNVGRPDVRVSVDVGFHQ
jgi:hypothetical protein